MGIGSSVASKGYSRVERNLNSGDIPTDSTYVSDRDQGNGTLTRSRELPNGSASIKTARSLPDYHRENTHPALRANCSASSKSSFSS